MVVWKIVFIGYFLSFCHLLHWINIALDTRNVYMVQLSLHFLGIQDVIIKKLALYLEFFLCELDYEAMGVSYVVKGY